MTSVEAPFGGVRDLLRPALTVLAWRTLLRA